MARSRSGEVGLIDLATTRLGAEYLPDLQKLKKIDATVVVDEASSHIIWPDDIWLLGDHRIICGDSTNAITVAKLLDGARPHLMVTDPPWGVEYSADWRNQRLNAGNRAVGEVLNDNRIDWREAWALFPGDVAYIWHASIHSDIVYNSIAAVGFEVRNQIIWVKSRFAISQGHYHPGHEPCLYAVRQGCNAHWYIDRFDTKNEGEWQSTVWNIKHMNSDTGHSTQKPVECMKKPIENNSKVGDSVYEPFSGSGTTIIAAEITGRKCYAVELDPRYVYIAINRWQEFTGKQARIAETGEPLAEVLLRRRSQTPPLRQLSTALPKPLIVPAAEDPVLAELIFKWYAPTNGVICDPFPQEIKKFVATRMGFTYTAEATEADLLYFCPELNDTLEPLWYANFLGKFLIQVKSLVGGLKQDRFAVIIADDARHSDGFFYGFIHHCAEAFVESGMRIWDEAIVPRQPDQAQWKQLTRKHTNILIFAKGKPKCGGGSSFGI